MLLDKREKYFGDIVPKERLTIPRHRPNPAAEETERIVKEILNEINSQMTPTCVDCAWCQPE